MKNLTGKIANIQVETDPNCSDVEKEIILKYWEMTEEYDWMHQVKEIKNEYELLNKDLVKKIQKKSSFSLYVHCDSCNSFELKDLSSRSTTYEFLCGVKKRDSFYICMNCNKDRKDKNEHENQKQALKEERFQKLVRFKAIENKVWKKLPKFDLTVLKNCIDFNDFENLKRYYKEHLGEGCFKNLFKSLKALKKKNLIQLVLDENKLDFWILDYSFHPDLTDKVKVEPKLITNYLHLPIPPIPEKISDELKFRLMIDSRSIHSERPRFGGTIKFPSDIFLAKDIKYAFAAWEKTGDEFYLTFIPLEKISNKPFQKRIHEEPKRIQDVIDRIFKGN